MLTRLNVNGFKNLMTKNIQHRIDNLCYQLVQGRVCLEPLRILAKREIVWNGWRVAFHVLGTSHAVVLERDGVYITELFTCAPIATDVPVLAQSQGVFPLALCPDVPEWDCRIALARFCLSEGSSLRLDIPIENTLDFTFPHDSGLSAPITRVCWKTEGRVLRIETVHTYPEENSGVRSETWLYEKSKDTRALRAYPNRHCANIENRLVKNLLG